MSHTGNETCRSTGLEIAQTQLSGLEDISATRAY